MRAALLTLIAVLLIAASAEARIITREVKYGHEDVMFISYLAYDDATGARRPGVLVIPEWWGLNEYAKKRARQLAEMGYVALAADMYGGGRMTTEYKEAAKLAAQVRGTPKMRERARLALGVLRRQPVVDADRLGAIGFCFGGTGVLELAWSGADVDAVVSFHGGLTMPTPDEAEDVKASILVLHGAADPHVKQETVRAFIQGMGKAKLDWVMVFYGGAVHSFTNPAAGRDVASGAAYDPKAAERSWAHMQRFLKESLKN